MQPNPPIRLAVILGSNREGRFAATVGGWLRKELSDRDRFEVDVIDLAEIELPATFPAAVIPALDAYHRRLAVADAFVVVTPEYNHAYPAVLKQAIDLAHGEWQAKPVAFVSYGGMSGGLRAVEQLRLVFAEVHSTTIRDVVSLHNPWHAFDADDRIDPATGAPAALEVMLTRLAWWAEALRAARQAHPYGA